MAVLLAGMGCASLSKSPEPELEPWVGQSATTLREVWGLPTRTYPAPNWQFWVYDSELPRSWQWFNIGSLSCEITFGLYRDRVSMTAWSGEAWICAKMARERPAP